MADTNIEFTTVTPPGQLPKITSIYDFSSESLGQLKLWFEMNPPTIAINQVTGFQQLIFNRDTTFPSNPINGQNFSYVVDATNGVAWNFRYNSGSASSYKWEATGAAAPLSSEVPSTGGEQTTSATYAALTTAGPSVTIPTTGDYIVAIGAQAGSGAAATAIYSYDIGGTGAVDADAVKAFTGAVTQRVNIYRARRKNGLAKGAVLTSKYRSSSAGIGVQFEDRWMTIIPVRVQGD